jgi:sugar phosphate isomerase/epimerase
MQGVFYRSVLDVTPTLDRGLLKELRSRADDLGMYLEIGLGKVNPFTSAEAPAIRAVGQGDTARGCRLLIESAADIGCREMWVALANKKPAYPGRFAYDRYRTDVTWAEQLQATERFLTALGPVARDLGVHLNIETHEEITSFEVVRMVESLGPDVAGVVFDTSNVIQRLEDPVAACRRVAPYVRQTHLKDACLERVAEGVRYQVRACGEGVIDFHEVLRLLMEHNPDLNLTLETRPPADEHVQMGALPTIIEAGDQDFVAGHADLTPHELEAFWDLVNLSHDRVRSGSIPSIQAVDQLPYGVEEALEVIRAGGRFVRRTLSEIDAVSTFVEGGRRHGSAGDADAQHGR